MGQAAHSAGKVTFKNHLPRDKFCKKYLSDPYHLNFKTFFIYESFLQALVTALAVNCPDDPHDFIIEKLRLLMSNEEILEALRWYAHYILNKYYGIVVI